MTYQCLMDDGRRLIIEAESAADAIQAALEQHRGHRVASCSRGTTGERGTGFIEYEVPSHSPLPEHPIDAPAPAVQSEMF